MYRAPTNRPKPCLTLLILKQNCTKEDKFHADLPLYKIMQEHKSKPLMDGNNSRLLSKLAMPFILTGTGDIFGLC